MVNGALTGLVLRVGPKETLLFIRDLSEGFDPAAPVFGNTLSRVSD